LVEAPRERGATMSRGPERDPLGRVVHVRAAGVVRRDQPRDVHEQVARRGLPGERMDGHGRRPTTADAGRAPWHEALAPTFAPTVLAEGEDGSLEFHAAEPPSDEEVARLLATIYRRVQRLLARRGLDVDDTPTSTRSPRNRPRWPASAAPRSRGGSRSSRAPAPASISSAASPTPPGSPRAGRAGRTSRASILHASITVGADDRAGVERLCRYVLRPPVAHER